MLDNLKEGSTPCGPQDKPTMADSRCAPIPTKKKDRFGHRPKCFTVRRQNLLGVGGYLEVHRVNARGGWYQDDCYQSQRVKFNCVLDTIADWDYRLNGIPQSIQAFFQGMNFVVYNINWATATAHNNLLTLIPKYRIPIRALLIDCISHSSREATVATLFLHDGLSRLRNLQTVDVPGWNDTHVIQIIAYKSWDLVSCRSHQEIIFMFLLSFIALVYLMQTFAVEQVFPTKLPKVPGCEVLDNPCTDGLSRCCDKFTFRTCVGRKVQLGDCRLLNFNKCVDGEGQNEDKAHCE